jgi:CheY-like chemotaxis protein
MNILILEDNPIRADIFKKLFKSQTLFITDKVGIAIKACEEIVFDIMFLDHDLEGKIWMDSNKEQTGYTFCKILVQTDFQKKTLCYVHSLNPIGANNMVNLLHDYGRDAICLPFTLIKERAII